MAGITQGRPELAVGEPIRLGNNDEFEIEQHPVSDRLIIRDTQNGKVAYVRKERGGQIGGDGVLIKALKEGKPMADDGRTYATIQQAERAASSWVFVPPGTYNEVVKIRTDGLTLKGSGYATFIDGGTLSNDTIDVEQSNNVTIRDLRVTNSGASDGPTGENAVDLGNNGTAINLHIDGADGNGILPRDGCIILSCIITNTESNNISGTTNGIIANNHLSNSGASGVQQQSDGCIVANNIIRNPAADCIRSANCVDYVYIGNRCIGAADSGIDMDGSDDGIIANNRVSDSTNSDIDDTGTNNLLDANLTGASN